MTLGFFNFLFKTNSSLISFLLIDTARAVIPLGQTEYLTWAGLRNLIAHARERLQNLDQLTGNTSTLITQFDQIEQCFTSFQPATLSDPIETNEFLFRLLEKAGIFQSED